MAQILTAAKHEPIIIDLFRQTGGGPILNPITNIHRGVIDLTNVSDTARSTRDNIIYPAHTHCRGIMQIAANLNQKVPWQPTRPLPVQRGEHPIESLLEPTSFQAILLATQQNPEDVVTYLTTIREQHVTTNGLRELMSHGEMTNDTILNTFLAILCAQQGLKFLSTYFLHILKHDKTWSDLVSWFATSVDLEDYSHPILNSRQPILIPCHVHGAHWVPGPNKKSNIFSRHTLPLSFIPQPPFGCSVDP